MVIASNAGTTDEEVKTTGAAPEDKYKTTNIESKEIIDQGKTCTIFKRST